MCDHSPNREAAMVTVAPGVWCDPCLVPIVKALNEGGLPTVASCCGHGKRPGKVSLADGRELFILPDFATARRLDDHFHRESAEQATPDVTLTEDELNALYPRWLQKVSYTHLTTAVERILAARVARCTCGGES